MHDVCVEREQTERAGGLEVEGGEGVAGKQFAQRGGEQEAEAERVRDLQQANVGQHISHSNERVCARRASHEDA